MPTYDQGIAVQPIGGDRFYIDNNAAPLSDQKGKLTGGIGPFTDGSNKRKLMQHKHDFISIASYERNTTVFG